MKIFSSLTPMQRGIAYSVLGLLILLDSISLLSKSIHVIVFLASLGLIFYGIKLTGTLDKFFKK